MTISTDYLQSIYCTQTAHISIVIIPVAAALPCWPQLESAGAQCNMDENFIYENITLRNITINDPQFSYGQGIVLGNPVTPMQVETIGICQT